MITCAKLSNPFKTRCEVKCCIPRKHWERISLVVFAIGICLIVAGGVLYGKKILPFEVSMSFIAGGGIALVPFVSLSLSKWCQKKPKASPELPRLSGNGNVIQKEIPLSSAICSLCVKEGITVKISQGDKNSLTISAEENLFPYFLHTTAGSKLNLGLKPKSNIDNTTQITFNLTLQQPSEILVKGESTVEFDSLELETFKCVVEGYGKVYVNGGSVTNQWIYMRGPGGPGLYDAKQLISKNSTVNISEGHASIRVSDELNATVIGNSASCEYSTTTPVIRIPKSDTGSGGTLKQVY